MLLFVAKGIYRCQMHFTAGNETSYFIKICKFFCLQGDNLLLGAPGLRYFTGGFVDLRQTDAYITEYEKVPTEINEMLGMVV